MKALAKKWKTLKTSCKQYLLQGLSAHNIAVTIAIGFIIGIVPLPGTTIVLCILMAILFKLNHILIQSINLLVYPLQLLLLIPFYHYGSNIFHMDNVQPISFRFTGISFLRMLETLGKTAGGAVLLWFIISIPAGILIYYLVKKTLVTYQMKASSNSSLSFKDSFSQHNS